MESFKLKNQLCGELEREKSANFDNLKRAATRKNLKDTR
jgi:hypothetical protein